MANRTDQLKRIAALARLQYDADAAATAAAAARIEIARHGLLALKEADAESGGAPDDAVAAYGRFVEGARSRALAAVDEVSARTEERDRLANALRGSWSRSLSADRLAGGAVREDAKARTAAEDERTADLAMLKALGTLNRRSG